MPSVDRPLHVLIVDDDDDTREMLRLVLEDAGYAVDDATNGKQALERLHVSPHPLVVPLDLWMPGMDGRQVLEAVAANSTLATRHAYLLLTALDSRTLPLAFVNLLTKLGVPISASRSSWTACLPLYNALRRILATNSRGRYEERWMRAQTHYRHIPSGAVRMSNR